MLHLISSCQDARAGADAQAPRTVRGTGKTGYTVLELLMAMAVIAVLAGIAIAMYGNYREKARAGKAVQDILYIQTLIDRWALENRYAYPDSLAEVSADGMRDPWDTPYQYTNLSDVKGKGKARKDKSLVPINTDYDLWSNGPDKDSVAPLTAKASRDDIVRANNGRYVGPAADY